MIEETIAKIEDEIMKKTMLPDDLKEKIRREIFINIMFGIVIIVYFIFLTLGSIDTVKAARSIDFKIFSLLLLASSISLFEIAYRKDSGKLAISGIEILLVSILTLFLPYIVFELDTKHQIYYIWGSVLIGIYYIVKSIIMTNKAKKSYKKQESDIKEITKKEKKKDILDEDIDGDIEKIKKNNIKKQEKESKNENKPKKRGRPRKVVN